MSGNSTVPVYAIGEAARILGVSVPTLRMYEKEGLILPYKKDSNHRLYSDEDIERLRCIRNAINENKISINGIRAIYSMIPCWKIVNCSGEMRQECSAFTEHSQPCWTYEHKKGSVCDNKNCRNCKVYVDHADCGNVKRVIKEIFQNM